MAQASSQHKLDRVRPPRVHITYDVEIGGAIEIKDLPFQLGVLGDFTGMPEEPLPRMRDRKFVEVNPDNFNEVLEGMKPHLAFNVENRLVDGAAALKVDLRFKSLDDFEAENVAMQVKPLRELLELRSKLNDLLGKLQGNDKLEEVLTKAINDPAKLKKLESEIRPSPAPITAIAAAAEAISVEPPAEVAAPSSHDDEAAPDTESIAEAASAAPTEAEGVDLAPAPPPALEEQVPPALEAEAIDPGEEHVDENKESEGPDEVHATKDKTD